jgi:hypothetical protein
MKGLDVPALVFEGEVLGAIVSLLFLAAVGLLVLRTRSLPACSNCGLHSVRRSHSHRFMDGVARLGLLHPYRCDSCLRRFYCFKSRRVPRHAHGRAAGSGK